MDILDPARILIVEAIAALEDAIEPLMPAQSPGSDMHDLEAAVVHLKTTATNIQRQAGRIDRVLSKIEEGS